MIGNCKQSYSNRRICELMTSNEIRYNSATLTFLLAVDLALKNPHTQKLTHPRLID
jgi:hypothetical protein